MDGPAARYWWISNKGIVSDIMENIKDFENISKIPMWEEIKINEGTTIIKVKNGFIFTKYGYEYEVGSPYVNYDKPLLMVFQDNRPRHNEPVDTW